jgi:GntR family transcriptional regulator
VGNEFDQYTPVYKQIMDDIIYKIISGVMAPGEKLPSIRDYAQDLKVNPNTVQRAYMELEREMITETRRGQGTFVTEDTTRILKLRNQGAEEVLNKFIEDMGRIGYSRDEIVSLLEQKLKEIE